MADRREPVQFLANQPVSVTFEFEGGKEFTDPWGNVKTAYSVRGNQIIFADSTLAAKINFCEPRPGDCLWITKRTVFVGRKRKPHVEWQVSPSEPAVIQRRNEYPATSASDMAAEMGIAESDLERELRESREIAEKAKRGAQARENIARRTVEQARENVTRMPASSPAQAFSPAEAFERELSIERKPAQIAAAPDASTGLKPSWYVALVAQTKDLVDALAEVRLHAEKHGQRVSFDDCEKLLVTSLIGKQRQRA